MDDGLSASELRQRYHRGGSARDDELSASQLKARYGITPNAKDFSTSSKTDYSGLVLVGVVVLIVLALLGYFLTQGSQQ